MIDAAFEENMNLSHYINRLVAGQDLCESMAERAMGLIMTARATPSQVAGYIVALRMKGETVEEITGSARAMRRAATRVQIGQRPLVDTCGTGGDGMATFNISTAAAIVTAAAGVPVAKHGNRSVSSACGSADVLEALGVRLDLTPQQVARCAEKIGIGFLFAPVFHTAMKHAIGPRRDLAIRTVFNILGPLTNPAGADVQLVGVYDADLTERMATVLGRLGVREAWVVHGNGLDELTVSGPSRVSRFRRPGRTVETFEVRPEEVGLRRYPVQSLSGGNAGDNARLLLSVLEGERGARRDAVLLNAAAALTAAGATKDLREGVQRAARAVDSGRALKVLENLVNLTQSMREGVGNESQARIHS